MAVANVNYSCVGHGQDASKDGGSKKLRRREGGGGNKKTVSAVFLDGRQKTPA